MMNTPRILPSLRTQPNEQRCNTTHVTHQLELPACCPVSGNPLAGSWLRISYTPYLLLLEVTALKAYIDSYKGGRGDVRSMEGMIQAIALDCARLLNVRVTATAKLLLAPGQKEKVRCAHG